MSREIVKAFSGILGRAIAIDPLQMIARLLSGLSAHDKAQRWTAGTVFFGRQAVHGAQMAFEHLELFAVFEADHIIWRNRLLDRDRRPNFLAWVPPVPLSQDRDE